MFLLSFRNTIVTVMTGEGVTFSDFLGSHEGFILLSVIANKLIQILKINQKEKHSPHGLPQRIWNTLLLCVPSKYLKN